MVFRIRPRKGFLYSPLFRHGDDPNPLLWFGESPNPAGDGYEVHISNNTGYEVLGTSDSLAGLSSFGSLVLASCVPVWAMAWLGRIIIDERREKREERREKREERREKREETQERREKTDTDRYISSLRPEP